MACLICELSPHSDFCSAAYWLAEEDVPSPLSLLTSNKLVTLHACQVGRQEPRTQRVGARKLAHGLCPPQAAQLPQEARRRALQLPGAYTHAHACARLCPLSVSSRRGGHTYSLIGCANFCAQV
eukprot:1144044-Pelagomonas_calceolata.AAC.2